MFDHTRTQFCIHASLERFQKKLKIGLTKGDEQLSLAAVDGV